MKMKIEFEDATRRLDGERRSKLLKKGSELYQWLEEYSNGLVEKFGELVAPKRMDYHFELIKRGEEATDELLVERAKMLEGEDVDISNLGVFYRAWVLIGPEVDGYGQVHCTIDFFRGGVPEELILSQSTN